MSACVRVHHAIARTPHVGQCQPSVRGFYIQQCHVVQTDRTDTAAAPERSPADGVDTAAVEQGARNSS